MLASQRQPEDQIKKGKYPKKNYSRFVWRRATSKRRHAKMGIKEKLAELELEMARTQKNKATEGHLGILKSKIAKLRTELLEPAKGPGSEATGFEVTKYGDARTALIGFPSVGKSTALSLLTGTESEAANYEFTTLTCIPVRPPLADPLPQ